MAKNDWERNVGDVVNRSSVGMMLSNAGLQGANAAPAQNKPFFDEVISGRPSEDWKVRVIVPFASHHFGAVAGTRNEGFGANMGVGIEVQYAKDKGVEFGVYESSYSGALIQDRNGALLRDKCGHLTGERYGREHVVYLAHNWEKSLAEGDGYTIKVGVSAGVAHGYAPHLPPTWQKYTPGGIVPIVAPSLSVDFSNSALKQIGISDIGIKARVLPARGEFPVAFSFHASF